MVWGCGGTVWWAVCGGVWWAVCCQTGYHSGWPGRVALDILPGKHLLLFSGALLAESARFGVWGLGCEIQGCHNTLRNQAGGIWHQINVLSHAFPPANLLCKCSAMTRTSNCVASYVERKASINTFSPTRTNRTFKTPKQRTPKRKTQHTSQPNTQKMDMAVIIWLIL